MLDGPWVAAWGFACVGRLDGLPVAAVDGLPQSPCAAAETASPRQFGLGEVVGVGCCATLETYAPWLVVPVQVLVEVGLVASFVVVAVVLSVELEESLVELVVLGEVGAAEATASPEAAWLLPLVATVATVSPPPAVAAAAAATTAAAFAWPASRAANVDAFMSLEPFVREHSRGGGLDVVTVVARRSVTARDRSAPRRGTG